eukprot:TRINITY_DN1735_c0_g2_i2.p1 TRINITY_DN1735_c0_g2~~TRINITY_DN1735_c0_g2_i2.p1  ORF type:complete len:166 (+),score=30.74 TRINITY_DN1735_c0_g2_i2:99-596(+)
MREGGGVDTIENRFLDVRTRRIQNTAISQMDIFSLDTDETSPTEGMDDSIGDSHDFLFSNVDTGVEVEDKEDGKTGVTAVGTGSTLDSARNGIQDKNEEEQEVVDDIDGPKCLFVGEFDWVWRRTRLLERVHSACFSFFCEKGKKRAKEKGERKETKKEIEERGV